MHFFVPLYIGVIVGAAILLFKASEYWWSSIEHAKFNERVATLWMALSESHRRTFVQAFLNVISGAIDQLYGRTVSLRAFWRVQFTTAIIYVVALAVIG